MSVIEIEVNSTYWIKGMGWIASGQLIDGTLKAWERVELYDENGTLFKVVPTSSYGKSGEKTFVPSDYVGLQLLYVSHNEKDNLPIENCILKNKY